MACLYNGALSRSRGPLKRHPARPLRGWVAPEIADGPQGAEAFGVRKGEAGRHRNLTRERIALANPIGDHALAFR